MIDEILWCWRWTGFVLGIESCKDFVVQDQGAIRDLHSRVKKFVLVGNPKEKIGDNGIRKQGNKEREKEKNEVSCDELEVDVLDDSFNAGTLGLYIDEVDIDLNNLVKNCLAESLLFLLLAS